MTTCHWLLMRIGTANTTVRLSMRELGVMATARYIHTRSSWVIKYLIFVRESSSDDKKRVTLAKKTYQTLKITLVEYLTRSI
ncbi:hypothetical protein VCHA44O286_30077 [Vibrio chagasii]|nr:hypothetical protein VCHA53O474_20108 [Vibrio chagasii]CAH7281536.1 hypothetical protein VCHA44O286_30077 [Vibrio chagasii]